MSEGNGHNMTISDSLGHKMGHKSSRLNRSGNDSGKLSCYDFSVGFCVTASFRCSLPQIVISVWFLYGVDCCHLQLP